MVLSKKSRSAYKKEIDEDQRSIILPSIQALEDMSKEDKEYQAKQLLKMIRFEPSELIHIYHKNCDIFLKNESTFDIGRVEEDINLSSYALLQISILASIHFSSSALSCL